MCVARFLKPPPYFRICCKTRTGLDWTGLVKHGFVQRGFVKQGLVRKNTIYRQKEQKPFYLIFDY